MNQKLYLSEATEHAEGSDINIFLEELEVLEANNVYIPFREKCFFGGESSRIGLG